MRRAVSEIKHNLDSESATAVILSFVGGLLDVYCLFNFGVYAMLHTGNIIKLVTYLLDGNTVMFLDTLFVILAFAAGIYLANVFEDRRGAKNTGGLLRIAILLLAVSALLPNDTPPGELSVLKMIAASVFGFEGAFLVHSFIRFGSYAYSATTMTANINRLVTNIYRRVTTKSRLHSYAIRVYLMIFLCFMLGVGAGYAYLRFLPAFSGGFMGLYGYNLILLLPLACLLLLLRKAERTRP